MSKSIIKQKRILTKAGGGSSISTPVSVANGGTGITSYTIGDLIYASGATTLAKLADVATGSVLVSGGVGVAPSWSNAPVIGSAINLGISSSATGSIVYKNSTNANTLTINSGVTSASYTLTLPTAQGGASTFLTNNGSGVLSWTTPSSGITVGTTTITSGTDKRVPYNNSGVYGELANFTIGAVAAGVLDVPIGYAINGTQILKQNTAGGNLFLGSSTPPTYTNAGSTIIGNSAGLNNTGSHNVFLGLGAGVNSGTASNCTFLGYTNLTASTANVIGSIFIGYEAAVTASHQGVLGSNNANGYVDNWYFNGVTHSSAYSVVLNACGGSGSNNTGANLTLAAGKSTGSATPAVINFQSTAAGASSSTAQTLATVLQITNSTTITTSDAVNYALGSTTGTKFGTANTQKLAFWNSTPVVQQILATGAAATVDDVITLLQTLGLCKQS